MIFGIKSLAVVAVCVGVCVLSEFLFNLIVKKEQTMMYDGHLYFLENFLIEQDEMKRFIEENIIGLVLHRK